jgi:hypothetical protein
MLASQPISNCRTVWPRRRRLGQPQPRHRQLFYARKKGGNLLAESLVAGSDDQGEVRSNKAHEKRPVLLTRGLEILGDQYGCIIRSPVVGADRLGHWLLCRSNRCRTLFGVLD